MCEVEIPVDGEMDRHCIKIKGKMNNVHVSAHQNICIEGKHGDSGKTLHFSHDGYVKVILALSMSVIV